MAGEQRGLPPALVIGAVLGVVVPALSSLLWAYGSGELRRPDDGWFSQFVFYGRPLLLNGAAFATVALYLAGFQELIRRVGAGPEAVFLRISLVGVGLILLALLASIYWNHWYLPQLERTVPSLRETLQTFWTWQRRVMCGAALVASGGLLLAGRRQPLVQALALPFLIVTLFAYPTVSVWELTHATRGSRAELWTETVVDIGIDLAFAACLLAVAAALARGLPPAPVDVRRAGNGLQRVGSALVARVVVLLIAAFTLVTTLGSRSNSLAEGAAVVFPFALLVTSIALVTGLLQAGGLTAAGAPRKRLYLAAAFTLTGVVVDALKALALYVDLTGRGENAFGNNVEQVAASLPYVAPAVTLAGLLCLLSGVQALRRWAPEAWIDDRAINAAAVMVTVCSVAAVVIMRWAQGDAIESRSGFVVVALFVASATVISQLAVARVCHRAAAEMRAAPPLPTAVVASSS